MNLSDVQARQRERLRWYSGGPITLSATDYRALETDLGTLAAVHKRTVAEVDRLREELRLEKLATCVAARLKGRSQ